MFDGFSFEKLVVVAVIAVFVVGPSRLPEAARRLGALVRQVRDLGERGKSRLRDELGEEVTEIEWRRLDPRQYDPRRIIRDALLDTPEDRSGVDAIERK
ncbi:twin-arginine translocase TatA/TatE family subunit [Leifsonia shinshuensis]|uniref:Sec-independent protein translocase TatB n=1 Tax=Leifsonia shinshuensis TaxID=150026 RepID=A0A7G6YA87_9MICO|nr:twin-arginine translocase TatA/TatE family subunit [Leifsonia shinshuensis]QNE35402.1 Sec-independent protein translocase TatB [Leifsonia shinshuensis]